MSKLPIILICVLMCTMLSACTSDEQPDSNRYQHLVAVPSNVRQLPDMTQDTYDLYKQLQARADSMLSGDQLDLLALCNVYQQMIASQEQIIADQTQLLRMLIVADHQGVRIKDVPELKGLIVSEEELKAMYEEGGN